MKENCIGCDSFEFRFHVEKLVKWCELINEEVNPDDPACNDTTRVMVKMTTIQITQANRNRIERLMIDDEMVNDVITRALDSLEAE